MEIIISHVCELLRPEAATRGIEITMSLPDSLPSVAADSAQLTQAVVNLVINARDTFQMFEVLQRVALRTNPPAELSRR